MSSNVITFIQVIFCPTLTLLHSLTISPLTEDTIHCYSARQLVPTICKSALLYQTRTRILIPLEHFGNIGPFLGTGAKKIQSILTLEFIYFTLRNSESILAHVHWQ